MVIAEGEERMRDYLRGKTLDWLYTTVSKDFPEDRERAISQYFGVL